MRDHPVTGPGVIPFDLAGNWCGECGRPKAFRLHDMLTGCGECDEVVTRHRCTGRPDITQLADGQAWECPDCGSRWTPRSREEACADCCGDCGHTVTVRKWDYEEGPRLADAPRHVPLPYQPIRYAPFRAAPSRSCYLTASGLPVHYRGCGCPR